MGVRQVYRGNPALKSTYLVSDLSNGMDTVTSDEVVSSKSMRYLLNVELGEEGVLKKRKGFSKENLLREFINKYIVTDRKLVEKVFRDSIGVQVLSDEYNILNIIESYNSLQDFELAYGVGGEGIASRVPFLVDFAIVVKSPNRPEVEVYHLIIDNNSFNKEGEFYHTKIIIEKVRFGEREINVRNTKNIGMLGIDFLTFNDKVYFDLSQISPDVGGFVELYKEEGILKGKMLDQTVKESDNEEGVLGAYEPTPYEVINYGFNILAENPLSSLTLLENKRIHALFLTDYYNPKVPLSSIPPNGRFTLNVMLSGFKSNDELEIELYYENPKAASAEDVKVEIPHTLEPVEESFNKAIRQYKIKDMSLMDLNEVFIEVFEPQDAIVDYTFGDESQSILNTVKDFEDFLFSKQHYIGELDKNIKAFKGMKEPRSYSYDKIELKAIQDSYYVWERDNLIVEDFDLSVTDTLINTGNKSMKNYPVAYFSREINYDEPDDVSFEMWNQMMGELGRIPHGFLAYIVPNFWSFYVKVNGPEHLKEHLKIKQGIPVVDDEGNNGYVLMYEERNVALDRIDKYGLVKEYDEISFGEDEIPTKLYMKIPSFEGSDLWIGRSKNYHEDKEYNVNLNVVPVANEEDSAIVIFNENPSLVQSSYNRYVVADEFYDRYEFKRVIYFDHFLRRYFESKIEEPYIINKQDLRDDGFQGIKTGESVRLISNTSDKYYIARIANDVAGDDFIDDDFVEVDKEELTEKGYIRFTAHYYIADESLEKEVNEVTSIDIKEANYTIIDDRLVMYKGNAIRYSDPFKFNYFPFYNYIILPLSPDDEIVKIQYFKGANIIFTRQEIWKIEGMLGYDNMVISKVNGMLGCIDGKSVRSVNNNLIFLSDNGLYALKQTMYANGLENVDKIDNHVDGIFKRSVYAESELYKGKYLLHLYDVRGGYIETVKLYFNLYAGASGRYPYVIDKYSSIPDLKIKFNNNSYAFKNGEIYIEGEGFRDFDKTYPMVIETPQYNFDHPIHEKKIKDINFKIRSNKLETIKVKVYYGSELYVSPERLKARVNDNGEIEYREKDYVTFDTDWSALGDFKVGEDIIGGNEYQIHKVLTSGKTVSSSVVLTHEGDGEVVLHAIGFTFKLGKVRGR